MGNLSCSGPGDALAARDDDEVRHVDAMIAEDFFRDAFVFAKDETGRAATGKGHALHFEKRNDVLVEPAVVLELVGEIENDVGREAFQFLPQQIEIVEDGEMLRRCSRASPSASRTFASVFQSSVFISSLKSWSIVVGRMASKRARTLSFFFTLFGALEFAGEKIVHHQRRDKRGDAKILLRIVVQHVKTELVAAVDQSREKFVYPVFFLVSPLADGFNNRRRRRRR